jgi:hypothetical protein
VNPDTASLVGNTYESVKKRFQRFAFQTQFGTYGVCDYLGKTRRVERFTQDRFKKAFAYSFYFDLEAPRAVGEKLKRQNFIERWIRDPHARRYNAIVNVPGDTDVRNYNEWEPFTAMGLPPVDDPAQVEADVAPVSPFRGAAACT